MLQDRTQEMRDLTAALAEPFELREVKFKPQQVKGNRCMAIAYIDARLIQDRLDETVGVENWSDRYKILADGSVMCQLRVKLIDQWITKTDVGSPSEQPDGGDRLKAAFSDALKRAAVKFGIGRYLYRLGISWVDYDPVKKQIVQIPQMPAFAIPKNKAAAKPAAPAVQRPPLPQGGSGTAPPKAPPPPVVPPQGGSGTAPPHYGAPTGKTDLTKPKPAEPGLPANGAELLRRLTEYDAKLAANKLCERGALVAHVTQAGVRAGYTADMQQWSGPAIPFATEAVRQFEEARRKPAIEPAPVHHAADAF